MLKIGGLPILKKIGELIRKIREEEAWSIVLICPIHQKEKVLAKTIKNRFENLAEKRCGEYQARFRSDRSVTVQILSLREIQII